MEERKLRSLLYNWCVKIGPDDINIIYWRYIRAGISNRVRYRHTQISRQIEWRSHLTRLSEENCKLASWNYVNLGLIYWWQSWERGGERPRQVKYNPLNSSHISWWSHQMETFSVLLAICAGNSPVPGEFPTQRPVTRSFDVFLDLRLNKRLSKQSWGWWFESLSRPLWLHRNVMIIQDQKHKAFVP